MVVKKTTDSECADEGGVEERNGGQRRPNSGSWQTLPREVLYGYTLPPLAAPASAWGGGGVAFFFSTSRWKLKRSQPQISMIMRELSLENSRFARGMEHTVRVQMT